MQLVPYVRYWFPGSFVSDDSTRPIDAPIPKGAYASQKFSRYETLDPRGGKMVSQDYDLGRKRIVGTRYTTEEIERLPGDHAILLGNMRRNGWSPVVKCAQGFLPLDKNDDVVDAL